MRCAKGYSRAANGRSPEEAASIIDILSPNATENTAIARWQDHLRRAAAELGVSIPDAPWMLSDRGWCSLAETFLLPLPTDPRVLTAAMMREHAAFPVFVADFDTRAGSIRALSGIFNVEEYPSANDQARTIESAAKALSGPTDVRWDHFWADVSDIFEQDLSPLNGKEVLLCTDGSLHAGGIEGRAIYFRPRQTGQDGDDWDEHTIDQVPAALQNFIALLDPRVPVTAVRDGRRQNTGLHKQLINAGLVSQFRREEVLSDILIPNLPPMPLRHGAPEAVLCRDALTYALRLAYSKENRGEGQGLLSAMAKMPVPCRGGWFPLSAAIFGRGWVGTQGTIVDRYLRLAGTESARDMRNRLLHGPDHPSWGGLGANAREILEASGVRDGLPLIVIGGGGKEPALRCDLVNHRFQKPLPGPTPIDDAAWVAFNGKLSALTSNYRSGRYKVDKLLWLPGLENQSSFDSETKKAFLDLVLSCASRWTEGWQTATLTRDTVTYDPHYPPSPLLLALSTMKCIPAGVDAGTQLWSQAAGRWYVPSRYTAGGRIWTFEHLSPLPDTIASRLEYNDALVSFFTVLGVAVYRPEESSGDLRLLNSLGQAVERKIFRNESILLGQLRAAWAAFEPDDGDGLPSRVVVQQANGSLALVRPSDDSPIYLPSSRSPTTALRDLGLSVIAIEPKAAQRLADRFASSYGAGVRNSDRFELVALSNDYPWTDEAVQQLRTFVDLDGVIPFVLTIAAFHGPNAQGTMSGSFNEMVGNFREARVAVLPDLAIVPMIGEQRIAVDFHEELTRDFR